jgi:hypothetical protein
LFSETASVSTPFARALSSAGISFAALLSFPVEFSRALAAGFSRVSVATGAGFGWRTGALRRETLGCGDGLHGQPNKKASASDEKTASKATLAVIAIKACL